jgi:hypothetical protein
MADEVNENPESIDDLSDEQLDALLEGVEDGEEDGSLNLEQELEVGAEEEADGDDDDADTDDSADDEPAEEEEEASEEEESDSEDENEEEAQPINEQMEGVMRRLEIMEADRDRVAAELDRERILRDRNAGKLGALMQQLEKTRDTPRADGSDEFGDDDGTSRQSSSTDRSPGEEALAEIRQGKVEGAIDRAAHGFYSENEVFFNALEREVGPEANAKFQADLVAKVRQHQADIGDEFAGMSPKMAGKMSVSLLRSAFADMKLELLRDFQGKASEQAEESRRKIRARKKGAAGTRSNKAAAVRTSKAKSLSKMSDAELDAALEGADFG